MLKQVNFLFLFFKKSYFASVLIFKIYFSYLLQVVVLGHVKYLNFHTNTVVTS